MLTTFSCHLMVFFYFPIKGNENLGNSYYCEEGSPCNDFHENIFIILFLKKSSPQLQKVRGVKVVVPRDGVRGPFSHVDLYSIRFFHTIEALLAIYIENMSGKIFWYLAFPYYTATFQRIYRKRPLCKFLILGFSILLGHFSAYI